MLEVRDLRVVYNGQVVLDDLALTVADGEVVAVLGPSGSGKSTLLRVVAGLERPAGGRIRWDGQELTSVPPHRRNFGLMFQDYALFPHRDVSKNVAFGLRMAGVPRNRIPQRVEEVLEWVGLTGFERRSVQTLSGGEQQRVALARALAPEPVLLMLDEPLGSLDRTLRERLVMELNEILSDPGLTGLYVTHDQEEAFTVADRVALIHDGRVVQIGTPAEVWSGPATEWVARFLGFTGIVTADVRDGTARTEWGDFAAPEAAPRGQVTLVIRPEALTIAEGGLRGTAESVTFRGGHYLLSVRLPGGPALEVVVPAAGGDAKGLPDVGADVGLEVDPRAISVLEGQGDGP